MCIYKYVNVYKICIYVYMRIDAFTFEMVWFAVLSIVMNDFSQMYILFTIRLTFREKLRVAESSFAQGHDAIWRLLSILSPSLHLKKKRTSVAWRNATIFSSTG